MKHFPSLILASALFASTAEAQASYYCASGWEIDPAFSPQERVMIISAMNRVNRFVGQETLVHENIGVSCYVKRTESLPNADLGYTRVINNEVFIDVSAEALSSFCQENYKNNSTDCFRTVVQHEFFHSLGAAHLPKGAIGVMSEAPSSWEFTYEDYYSCKRSPVCSSLIRR